MAKCTILTALLSCPLAETEKIIDDIGGADHHAQHAAHHLHNQQRSYTPQPSPSPSMTTKNKGLRGIFGKIKRSNSGNLEDLPADSEFRRGGVRSTAGGRLGWHKGAAVGSGSAAATAGLSPDDGSGVGNRAALPTDKPFAEWDVDAVCEWLADMGLECYEEETRRWLGARGAADLLSASAVDIEKELGLRSPLHRKKITLALADAAGSAQDELMLNAGKLDPDWVSAESGPPIGSDR